ncbi:MAG: hypothetical protein ACD_81C00067G0004 [uncultured bacterium]|uniref:WD40 repeat domain-containing protein n=2 Tax=Candidatus Wolfeibacteriota TaxID=1752735 RepID=A0A0G1H7X5_9BACT|nr:MAG: hypothetical protein ACD_81C00067G0004 [uncultured bacterium]KKR12081.1 MAG: hypothetical protein UT41_C0003G0008 [Candidatus Wolfebacteria bacterium GW2011_GWC2_39_22]KKT42905.1 MAG: hypothetical protein UW32_C0003G0008 [Candidatus Wolfebacteria bacterium GW2011_GWE2_44_13]HBI25314.1 hypothetical protein [Candidatus Wolfebacteria bacterium]
MERNKKIIIGASAVLGVIALGIGAYFAWQNRAVVISNIPGINNEPIQPLEQKKERLRAISSRTVAGYWIADATSSPAILYVDSEGSIITVNNESDELLYEQSIANIRSVRPSANGEAVFIEAQSSEGIRFNPFDLTSNLPGTSVGGVEEITWAPKGKDAAYIIQTGDVRWLRTQVADVIGLSDTAKFLEVTKISQSDFTLQWPQSDVIYVTQKPSAEYVSDMWRVDVKTKTIAKFLSDRGLIVQWAPFGTRALKFTTTEGRKHKLALIDDKGNELNTLRFITLPDKCAITAPEQMYCAIPRDQAALARMTLPDDYLKRDVYFQDGIYQIDLTNNGIRAIFEDENPKIDATNLTVLEDKIVFINRYDKKLYSLDLQ